MKGKRQPDVFARLMEVAYERGYQDGLSRTRAGYHRDSDASLSQMWEAFMDRYRMAGFTDAEMWQEIIGAPLDSGTR